MTLTAAVQAEIDADLASICEVQQSKLVIPRGSPLGLMAASGAIIRLPPNQSITVVPHLHGFATALMRATGLDSFGTYNGHSPPQGPTQAIDIFHRVSDRAASDAMCEFFLANWERFGLRYIISRQQIWHRLDPVWRWMADLGDNTKNHQDHGHVTAESDAPDLPQPQPEPQGDPTTMLFRYIYDGIDWVFDGPSRLFFHCDDVLQITEVLDVIEVPALGKVSKATHQRYQILAAKAGFTG